MKKFLRLLLIMFICIPLISCEINIEPIDPTDPIDPVDPPVVVTKKLELDVTSCVLEIGSSKTVTASLEGIEGSITWVSSDEKIATVKDGKISALSAGKCTITASIDSLSKTVSVTVNEKEKEQVAGIISLDKQCNLSYSNNNTTATYNGYTFELNDISEYSNGYVTLSKGGYILNTTPFGNIESFQVEYDIEKVSGTSVQSDYGFGSLYYVTDSHKITAPGSYNKVEVKNNTLITLEDSPAYLALYTYNKINIKSITINYDSDAKYTESNNNFDIHILATNDIHGQVNPDDTHGGLENASGYIESVKKNNKYNILLDQGDIYQGSLACYLTKGHIADDYLLMNGYESTILGNHEWDWMEENILEHRDYSKDVKLLACNVRYKDGTTPDWVRNYYVTERGGVKIGVIGALGDIAGDISADMIENIKFVTGSELDNMLIKFSNELKELGCSYIILQIHAGSNYSNVTDVRNAEYTEVDYSKLQGKIDLVLESHSHRNYYHLDNYGIAHIQCGGYFSGFGDITLQVEYKNNQPVVSIKDHNIINANKLKTYKSEFFNEVNSWYSTNVYKEKSEEVVATVSADITEKEINQLAGKAYYALKDEYEVLKSYDICLGGGYINCRSPKLISKGNVTMSNIANLFPFDNEMYLCKINGKDLKYNFLNKNGYVYDGIYDKSSTLDFGKYYYIIIDSYNYFYLTKQLSTPADISIVVNLTEIDNVHPREAVAKYLSKNYQAEDKAVLEILNTSFDYAGSTKDFEVVANKDKVTISLSYSGLSDNSKYSQFIITKTNGIITITCSAGYNITNIELKQYQQYENLKFYSDTAYNNEITSSPTADGNNSIYYINNTTNTFVIKNTSNYDVKVYYLNITVEKITK